MEITNLLNFTDIQHLILIKLCWYVFIAGSLILIFKRAPHWVWAVWTGGLTALAYVFLVGGLPLTLWGLQGDEVTIAAMYEQFAHGGLWRDFAYAQLPPFYPALFFQIFALVGRALDWNGVQMAKFASAVVIATLPIILYGVQRAFWRRRPDTEAPGALAWLLPGLLVGVFLDWDALITKPYEALSVFGVVLWTAFLLHDLKNVGAKIKSALWYGVTGGVLFLTFYFWFFLAAIGISLYNFFGPRVRAKQYAWFAFIGVIVLAIGVVYWLPLTRATHTFGAENWQLGYLLLPWLATHGPKLEFSLRALLMLVGLGTLIFYRGRTYIRALLALFVAGYIWQLMGLTTIFTWASPLQESKGFDFWNTLILLLAASYGLEKIWQWGMARYPQVKAHERTAMILALLILSPHLLFGYFVDNPKIQETRVVGRAVDPGVTELAQWLVKRDPHGTGLTLSPGVPQLPAFVPINQFVYYNMHNSHPAARFSERWLILTDLARAKSATEFYELAQHNQFGPIKRIVCFADEPNLTKGDCPIFLSVDDFPRGSAERVVHLPRQFLLTAPFMSVYKSNRFEVFETVVPQF